jgi:hypothetical protein
LAFWDFGYFVKFNMQQTLNMIERLSGEILGKESTTSVKVVNFSGAGSQLNPYGKAVTHNLDILTS